MSSSSHSFLSVSVSDLPVFQISDKVNASLSETPNLVVTAPPGAGKSTLLPLTILEAFGKKGKILMLEPRRLAARQIAERMASLLGEPVGKTVGYRIRFETKVSQQTRIEVLTEGILTRMLVSDPTLEGTAVLIFDEFHERSLQSDTALALARETQSLVRPDLRILIMSATIDAEGICKALGARHLESEGRMFPVEVLHSQSEASAENCAEAVSHVIRQAHREHEGDILAFLPGEGEIRRCQELLGDSLGETGIFPLYGNLSQSEQKAAIAPSSQGSRKVVLATPIAETSLTIEGVRIVVDSGLYRKMVFNPQNSLSHLETCRISKDMADQRTGRAGRVASGICYRLWNLAIERQMADCRTPEILDADLSDMTLSTAAWGQDNPMDLPWMTPPPLQHIRQAKALLESLGAIDASGKITSHGRKLAAMPCHPRIAQMLLKASEYEPTGEVSRSSMKALACDIAAVLEEKDPLPLEEYGCGISLRISSLRQARSRDGNSISRKWARIEKVSQQYRQIVRIAEDSSEPDPFEVGILLSSAYPERIGKELPEGCGKYLLASGDIVAMDASDELSAHGWIVASSLNTRAGGTGRIFLGAPVAPESLKTMSRTVENISWDSKAGAVICRKELRIGKLLLDSRQISDASKETVQNVICGAAAKEGTSMLDFNDEVVDLQRRVAAVASWHPDLDLPDLSTEAVLSRAKEWLPFYIGKATTRAELKKIDLSQALWSLIEYSQQQEVDRLAPTHIEVPTGSHIRVEYRLGAEAPVLRVRLQECFGLIDTPKVDGGRRPVLMELLSPGFKPVQLTQDLASFWKDTYFEVRKELRRRYPKHSWPDNPLEAQAVRGIVRKK